MVFAFIELMFLLHSREEGQIEPAQPLAWKRCRNSATAKPLLAPQLTKRSGCVPAAVACSPTRMGAMWSFQTLLGQRPSAARTRACRSQCCIFSNFNAVHTSHVNLVWCYYRTQSYHASHDASPVTVFLIHSTATHTALERLKSDHFHDGMCGADAQELLFACMRCMTKVRKIERVCLPWFLFTLICAARPSAI